MSKNLTTEQFIERAKGVHGDLYDYSLVTYVNNKTNVEIICKTHGNFWQTPATHLNGSGCVECAIGKNTKKLPKFIEDARGVHGNIYDYSLVAYTNARAKVQIICETHGSFWQCPDAHLRKNGCPKCGTLMTRKLLTKPYTQFIEDAKGIHGEIYGYCSVTYVGCKTKMQIICGTHGSFWQTPDDHLSGNSCPSCASYGFNPEKEATLYYLSVYKGTAYKIGITNRTVEERFSNAELENIDILEEWYFKNGQAALDKEQEILKEFKWAQYSGDNLLVSGNTELFMVDILNKDKGNK